MKLQKTLGMALGAAVGSLLIVWWLNNRPQNNHSGDPDYALHHPANGSSPYWIRLR